LGRNPDKPHAPPAALGHLSRHYRNLPDRARLDLKLEGKLMRRFGTIAPLVIATLALLGRPGWAQTTVAHGAHGQAPVGSTIGEVDFPTSCSPDNQHRFNHAVWLLHSFWYEESLKAFTAISVAEPDCAIAYWGIAMSGWYPLWYPPSPAMLKSGAAAVAQGLAAPPRTGRERAYLEAIGRFYQDSDKLDHATRARAYAQAMEDLHGRYPDDREGAVFYALALDATWPPTDKSYANLKRLPRSSRQCRPTSPIIPASFIT
jgi:hypothetical protein